MNLVSIGEYIKLTRKKAVLTIKELSLISGVSEPTIHKIEKGKSVNLDKLANVCDALHKRVDVRVWNKR